MNPADQPPPSSERDDHVEVSTFQFRTLLPWLAVGLLALAAYYFYQQSRNAPLAGQQENVKLQEELANLKEQLNNVQTSELYLKQEQDLAMSKLIEAAAKGKQAETAVSALDEEVANWRDRTASLLATEQGKRIAADESALEKFHALYAKKRPDPDLPKHLKQVLDAVLPTIRQAIEAKNSQFVPNEQVFASIQKVADDAREAAEVYQAHNRQLESIITTVPDSLPADTPLLKDALADLERKWAAEEADIIATELKKAREENARTLAAAKAEAERKTAEAEAEAALIAGDLQAKNIVGAAQDTKNRADAQREAERLAAEKAKLRAEALSPTVINKLLPFVTPGYIQPTRISGTAPSTTKTPDKQPMSFSKLQSMGVLDRTADGVRKLGYLTGRHFNDRPSWDNPSHEFVSEAQALLIKYGPILVEEGKLLP
jgi:hypothetical protein